MGTLNFEPQIPPALCLTLLVISIALLFWYGWVRPAAVPRRRFVFILGWMALGLGLVLLILLNPTWIEPQSPPEGKPVLTVLVDATASMAMRDAPPGETRYRAAAQIARVLTKDLGDRFEVRVRTFAENPVPADAEDLDAHPPDGQVTDL